MDHDTYDDAPPAVTADHLKAVVLEAAWRRAVSLHALRVLQAVEHCRTDVLREITDDTRPPTNCGSATAQNWAPRQARTSLGAVD